MNTINLGREEYDTFLPPNAILNALFYTNIPINIIFVLKLSHIVWVTQK